MEGEVLSTVDEGSTSKVLSLDREIAYNRLYKDINPSHFDSLCSRVSISTTLDMTFLPIQCRQEKPLSTSITLATFDESKEYQACMEPIEPFETIEKMQTSSNRLDTTHDTSHHTSSHTSHIRGEISSSSSNSIKTNLRESKYSKNISNKHSTSNSYKKMKDDLFKLEYHEQCESIRNEMLYHCCSLVMHQYDPTMLNFNKLFPNPINLSKLRKKGVLRNNEVLLVHDIDSELNPCDLSNFMEVTTVSKHNNSSNSNNNSNNNNNKSGNDGNNGNRNEWFAVAWPWYFDQNATEWHLTVKALKIIKIDSLNHLKTFNNVLLDSELNSVVFKCFKTQQFCSIVYE